MKIYELAQNYKEAKELFDLGYGYNSKMEATDARIKVEDSYYRNLLKIYTFEIKEKE